MGLISGVLLFPITGPARGLTFIFEQIKEQVDEELRAESSHIEEELLDLALRYEQGAITDQDYAAQETALLEQLNEIRKEQACWLQEDMENEGEQTPIEDSDATDEA